jgi:hypothetical protein
VDILLDEDIVNRYYGDDGRDIVHLGRLIKNDKYGFTSKDHFLGRALRISKSKYKQMNGFPNTFYGWGGEDDALVNRIGMTEVYRPNEPKKGIEMETKNDIFKNKTDDRVEMNKLEQLILDDIQWKIDGVNSLQYTIEENVSLNPRARKITVQLNPTHHGLTGGMIIRTAEESDLLPDAEPEDAHETIIEHLDELPQKDSDELEVVENTDTLENGEAETKVIDS